MRRIPTIEVQIRDDNRTVLPEGEVGEISCTARSSSRATGTIPTPLPRCSTPSAGTTAATTDASTTGVLWLESRMRDLIIRAGENIYPMEIEHRLIEHPTSPTPRSSASSTEPSGRRSRRSSSCTRARRSNRPPCRSGWGSRWPRQGAGLRRVRDSLPYTQTGKVMKHRTRTRAVLGLARDRRRVARRPLPRLRRPALQRPPRTARRRRRRWRPPRSSASRQPTSRAAGFSGGSSCLVVRHVVTASRRTVAAAAIPAALATSCQMRLVQTVPDVRHPPVVPPTAPGQPLLCVSRGSGCRWSTLELAEHARRVRSGARAARRTRRSRAVVRGRCLRARRRAGAAWWP